MKAVIEQTTMVSMNTSKMPMTPCSEGCFTFAMPWAIGALPIPASFDSTPRLTPAAMTCATDAPTKPPNAAAGCSAPAMICPSTAGICPALIRM